jgi:hemolysin activation/secretion protein
MIWTHSTSVKRAKSLPFGIPVWPFLCLLLALCVLGSDTISVAVAEPLSPTPATGLSLASNTASLAGSNTNPGFDVRGYVIEGNLTLATNLTAAVFSKYTGTNLSLMTIAKAASALESLYLEQGYSTVNIVIAPQRITNGIVTMSVFQGAIAQIVISGKRYEASTNANEIAGYAPQPESIATPAPATVPVVTTPAVFPAIVKPAAPATPEEMAKARADLMEKMAALNAQASDTRVHVVSTNTGPTFPVQHYLIMGNSVLSPAAIARTMTNIDGAYGTNVSLEGIRTAVTELQKAYRARGYVTVSVGLPQQKLTNETVKIQVTEGRLDSIEVRGNHYFSSNNVMRALPSLHTNIILNSRVFEAELNRANANQDRQIYPVISPGPFPGTSDLTLKVKDQLPLHAKVELNNESTPGTPALRVNSSAVYNNLWQLEHSLGLQYGFSPEEFKDGSKWNFYDRPQVANYSGYYRMPLGGPAAIEDQIESQPGSFGYDEATRRFNLPPPSGQPELNVFASRSTIDPGLQTLPGQVLFDNPGVQEILQDNVQEDLTVNNDVGFRFSAPLKSTDNFHSDFSGGLDYKTYQSTSTKTNIFQISQVTIGANGQPNPPTVSSVYSAVPTTIPEVDYLPVSLHYSASLQDEHGTTAFGLGLSVNTWFHSTTTTNSATSLIGLKSLQSVTSSSESHGNWVVLNPSLTRDYAIRPGWILTLRADGQWASEPLISNEQFGAGGVNSVRGYREGEVFGDTGWHFSVEQQTPAHVVGMVYGNTPLTISGSIYMDYARVYLLDPQGRPPGTSLWGAGVGGVASVGSHWQARFLFSVPLLGDATTQQYEPFVNISLTAQF